LCRILIQEQIPQDDIHLVKDIHPFTEALRASLEVGIETQKEWLMVVDADTLVQAGAIDQLVALAGSVDEGTFEIHTRMLDKFFGGIKDGGAKMYRVNRLSQAISKIPDPA